MQSGPSLRGDESQMAIHYWNNWYIANYGIGTIGAIVSRIHDQKGHILF